MAYAVSLLFDTRVAGAVFACWQRLADAGLSRSMLDLSYQPHVTLAVFDELDVVTAVGALDAVLIDIARLDVTLAGIKTFGAGSGVCYLALAPQPDLIRLHTRTLQAIGEACRPDYQTGRWTPHCTLALNLSDADMNRAQSLLEREWRSLAGALEAVELVEFAPVTSIKRWALRLTPPSSRTP